MPLSDLNVEIRGVPYFIRTGQSVEMSQQGSIEGMGAPGDRATVLEILKGPNRSPDEAYVYLERETEHENWEEGLYAEIWVGDFVRFFEIETAGSMVVNRDYNFKKRNLKGMRCRILASMGRRDVVVEMEEDIGGSSADGVGKKGRCIPIKREFLTSSKKKSKAKEE